MSLSRKEKEERLKLLEEKFRRQKTRKIYSMYPEDGPLSRHAYKKHMLFLAMGKTHRERAAVAANRIGKCLTYASEIDTVDNGSVPVGELFDLGEPFDVWAYNSETGQRVKAKASAPFRKFGVHDCYRVVMSDGRWFEAADNHRLLTSKGWMFVRDLFQSLSGTQRRYSFYRILTSLASFLSEFPQDAAHSSQITRDFRGSCSIYHHPGGELLLHGGEIFQEHTPSPAGVQQLFCSSLPLGGQGSKCTGSHQRYERHPSNRCAGTHFGGRFVAFLSRVFGNGGSRYHDSPPKSQRFLSESFRHLRRGVAKVLDLFGFFSQLNSSLVNIDDNRVTAVYSVGSNEVYDFEVLEHHTYCAAGLVHHNTEGMSLYELVIHMTGEYPEWWVGKRFVSAPKCWAAGTTNQKTKEILQEKLIGPLSDVGTGLIPADKLADYKKKASSVPDTVEMILVKHITGDLSVCVLKSFEQGRTAFEGTEQDIIVLDEEPPEDVYEECLIRTMTTRGIIMLTFTPLRGVSDVVKKFMVDGVPKEGEINGRFLVCATWDDAPHLTEDMKREMIVAMSPHQRDARSKGIPSLGEGSIYPIMESEFMVDDFPIPAHWPRAYGFDVGWKFTAAVWGAYDPESDVLYLNSCYKMGQALPLAHVEGISARGKWIPGAADPAARIGNQKDGENLLDEYIGLGLKLVKADNSVETGLLSVWMRLSTGKLKVFKSLSPWFSEFRTYQRDKHGKVKKENDHLMDCTRYLVMTGLKIARVMPLEMYAVKVNANPDQSVYDPLTHGM